MKQSHAIQVDLDKILPILAKEIYNTPYAFVRENVQNALDAIRIQRYRESRAQLGRMSSAVASSHSIDIEVHGKTVSIRDTGTGMSRGDLENHYWVIGQSGKRTQEAKEAGVVGTFGIGGMANFGVCRRLEIVTRTEYSDEAIKCWAAREQLSVSEDCVFYEPGPPRFERGTCVIAELVEAISVEEVKRYLGRIVQYLELPVSVNGTLLSRSNFPFVDEERATARKAESGIVKGRVLVTLAAGSAELICEGLTIHGNASPFSRGFVRTGSGGILAYQNGFLLSQVPVASFFGLEGVLDSPDLRPTAGREALTDDSHRVVQSWLSMMEDALAETVAEDTTHADRFSGLFAYIHNRQRWQLAGNVTIRQFGAENRVPLKSFLAASKEAQVFYCKDTSEKALLEALRAQGKRVAILSADAKRQMVEQQYLTQLCRAKILDEKVDCTEVDDPATLSHHEAAFVSGVLETLRTAHFVESVGIRTGRLTHDALVWAPPKIDGRVGLIIDIRNPQVARIIEQASSPAFAGLVSIFVRDSVFPHLESVFPELRSRDFDALLRKIQSAFEQFKVDPNDVNRLKILAEATSTSPQTIARAVGSGKIGEPRPTTLKAADVVDAAKLMTSRRGSSNRQSPSLRREDVLAKLAPAEVPGKLIDARSLPGSTGIGGYYLAITPESHVLYRYVFERKPSADFFWGGHRAGYVFYNKGSSILYYDIELKRLIEPDANSAARGRAGTIPITRESLLTKNMVFIPIPDGFERHFVPQQSALTFVIRHKVVATTEADYSNAESAQPSLFP